MLRGKVSEKLLKPAGKTLVLIKRIMKGQEIVELVKGTPQVLSLIYSDLAQPGVQKVGTALGTVLEFSTSLLLPIKLLNEKFRLNFEKNLNNYKSKIEQISDEDLCEVDPQIGTPIIEKLSYTTNEEIADLFTNVLAMASSINSANLAHPAYIQLVERLSVDEARIIKHLKNKNFIPSVSFKAYKDKSNNFNMVLQNGTILDKETDLIFPQNLPTYLDNLVSLGILDNSHGYYKTNDKLYAPILKAHTYEDTKKAMVEKGDFEKLEISKSYYQITNFGKSFIDACTK